MQKDNSGHYRLPRNFHKTFIPERQYINAMLRFAASGGIGDYQDIASKTGIPMGNSSGKVPSILDYCKGMGLVKLNNRYKKGIKKPELTSFGRTVLLNDPFLKERVTQWIAHLNLCSPIFGADVWYYTFFKGFHELGMSFQRENLTKYLALIYQINRSNLIGPLIRMYQDEASFHRCNVLSDKSSLIYRKKAPIVDEFGLVYGAWILQLMSDHFPHRDQISVTELDDKAGWCLIPGWNTFDANKVLELIQRKGIIEVDRYMNPWLLRAIKVTGEAWKKIYNDLI